MDEESVHNSSAVGAHFIIYNSLQYINVDVIRLGIMFVHDNNVSVSCTVPLLTLHKAAYLQIAYGKLHSATFQQYTLVG